MRGHNKNRRVHVTVRISIHVCYVDGQLDELDRQHGLFNVNKTATSWFLVVRHKRRQCLVKL